MSAHIQQPVAVNYDDIYRAQRTHRGVLFSAWYDEVRNLLDGKTPEQQRKAAIANQDFIRGVGLPTSSGVEIGYVGKAVTPGAVHVDTLLSTFSVMYANDEFIGERLLPPVTVDKRSNKFSVYPKRERFAYPDDTLGYRSRANEIDASRNTDNYSVKDYGLANFLDLEVLQNQDAPLDEMLDHLEALNEAIAFRREKRIAAIVQAAANYGANTAAASAKWDTANTGGTIIGDIIAGRDAVWRGRNRTRRIGVTTLDNWNSTIINNPALNDKYKYTNAGLLTQQLVAGWFGLDELLIASAREDTANEGQASASYSRIWGTDFFAILTVATRPTLRSLSFGVTFRMQGDPVTTEWMDPAVGKRGGIYARVAVSEDHKIVAPDAAFLITDVKT